MKLIFKSTLILSSLFLVNSHAASQVTNISSENLVQIGKEAYWSADVSCDDGNVRAMQRKTDGTEWCGKDISIFCDIDKDTAANEICGGEYSAALALAESTKKAQSEAKAKATAKANLARAKQKKLAEKTLKQAQEAKKRQAAAIPIKQVISIDEQLVLIEQERLNLRRQELELQKRAIEIEKLLEALTP